MRPILLVLGSVYHNAPSGPLVMSAGAFPEENSVMGAPDRGYASDQMRFRFPQNHIAPSGPAVMPIGEADELASGELWSQLLLVVIRPILPTFCSVNQSAPSGPAAMATGPALELRRGNSVMTPAVVMRPILLLPDSVNQSAPSDPAAMPAGLRAGGTGVGNSVMPTTCAAMGRQMLSSSKASKQRIVVIEMEFPVAFERIAIFALLEIIQTG